MTQDNYRIPVTRPGPTAARDPRTDEVLTSIGQSDVRVPNPPGTSTYPSRPAPLRAGEDPNVYNPYAPSAPIPNRAFEVSDAEQRRIEARRYDSPLAERMADSNAPGHNYRPVPRFNMATEAENYVTLLQQGHAPAVADAATNNMRYPTRSGSERGPTNDALDARAIERGRAAYQSYNGPEKVRVGGREVDGRLYAVATAVRSELQNGNAYPYERYPESLREDTATLTRAVQDIASGRQR